MQRIKRALLTATLTIAALAATACQGLGGGTTVEAPDGESHFTMDPHSALQAFRFLVEENIRAQRDALAIIAASEQAASGDWQRIRPLLQILKETAGEDAYWYALPDGSYWTVEKGKIQGKNLSTRAYFPRVLAGQSVAGDLIISKSTGRRAAIVAVPVTRRKQVVGALGVSVMLDDLTRRIVGEMALADDLLLYAMDPDTGELALDRDTALIMSKPAAFGDSSNAAARKICEQESGAVRYEYEGRMREVLFITSPLTGWRFAIGKVLQK